jgi:aspartyl-tRNA(Asn)/glutamyl-tRNA(Gln) amidotransferase subunit A
MDQVVPEVRTAFDSAVAALRSLGIEVVETERPSQDEFRLATSLGLIVSRCEAAAFHSSFVNAGHLYTRPVFEQLDEASKVRAVDYLNAQRFRSEFRDRMLEHFDSFDALLMPTSRVPAPKTDEAGQFQMILSENCIPWSFIGFPAISVPCGFTSSGLPVGAQFVAAPFDDCVLFTIASALESALPRPNWAGLR